MIPVDSSTPEAQQLIKYTRGVLDALQLNNCPTHGWDGAWAPLCKALTGYCQIDAGVDAHVNRAAFDSLPDVMPSPFKASGQSVMLVNYFSGVVRAMPGYEKMRKLSSFESLTTRVKVGSRVELTIDLFTAVGVLVLINSDEAQLQKDIAAVRNMEKEGLFELEDNLDPPQHEVSLDTAVRRSGNMSASTMSGKGQAIVIVDPVSSGGCLAYEMYERGYAVIAVFCAELTEAFRKGPAILDSMTFYAQIDEREGAPISETAAAVKNACGSLTLAA